MQHLARTRGVRGAASWCALGAIGYLFASSLMQGLLSWLMGLRVAGASLASPVGFTPAGVLVLRLVAQVGAIALPLAALLYATRLQARDLRILLPGPWSPPFCLGLFLGLANLANLLGGLLNRLLGLAGGGDTLPAGGVPLLLQALLLCIVPAVGEELLFRGALQGLMRPCGSAAAILGPALLFALLHLDLAQGLTALACGIFLGWLAERSGSILPGMLLHLINNVLAFLHLYLQLYAPEGVALAMELALLLGCPLLACLLLWRAARQGFRFAAGMRPGPPAGAVFTSPAYTAAVIFLLAYTLYLQAGGAP